MKIYWGSGGIAPCILDLGTRWRWVVNFTPWPLYPRERAPSTHWIGPRAGLDAVVKRKFTSPCQDTNPRLSRPLSRAIPLNYPGCYGKWVHLKLLICPLAVQLQADLVRSPSFASKILMCEGIWDLMIWQNHVILIQKSSFPRTRVHENENSCSSTQISVSKPFHLNIASPNPTSVTPL
jgi:hypothetical protein